MFVRDVVWAIDVADWVVAVDTTVDICGAIRFENCTEFAVDIHDIAVVDIAFLKSVVRVIDDIDWVVVAENIYSIEVEGCKQLGRCGDDIAVVDVVLAKVVVGFFDGVGWVVAVEAWDATKVESFTELLDVTKWLFIAVEDALFDDWPHSETCNRFKFPFWGSISIKEYELTFFLQRFLYKCLYV